MGSYLTQHPHVIFIAAYMLGVIALSLYLSRFVRSDEDFFLAGRSLNMWIVAGTIMATDIAALYIVGPAGNAYESGVPVLLCGWTGNMIAAVSALVFVPRLRRLRMTTITEVMEERYNVWLRLLPTLLWIIYYALLSGNFTYVLSAILAPVLGVQDPNQITLMVGGLVILYCFVSGLMAVAYTDVFQAFLIILGSLILLPFSLKAVGGVSAFVAKTPPEYFVFWKSGVFPNSKDLLMFVLIGLPYWCTSQYMLQRSFAGRSVRDASRGLALAALMTGPITFAYILPGICGQILYPPGTLAKPDLVLPRLFMDILPVGLAGVFIAALLAAANSSAAGVLSSMSTLANHDLYRRFIPGKSTRHYLWVGRIAVAAGGCAGLVFAYNVERLGGILAANMEIMTTFEPIIFVPIAGALLWRSANTWGAIAAVAGGVLFNAIAWGCRILASSGVAAWPAVRDSGSPLGTDTWPQALSAIVSFFAGLTAADRCFVTFPLCLGILVIFSWIGQRVRPRSEAKVRQVNDFFARMKGGPIDLGYLPGWLGLVCAVTALGSIISIWLVPDLLPKPLNVVVHLGCLAVFVFGCYLTVPMFVSEDEEAVAIQPGNAGTIEGTLLQRVLGSGKSWCVIYGSAVALVFILYLGPSFPFKIVLREEKIANVLVLSVATNDLENVRSIAEDLIAKRPQVSTARVLFYAVGETPGSAAPVARLDWTRNGGLVMEQQKKLSQDMEPTTRIAPEG